MEIEKPEPVDMSELNFVDDEDLQESLARARRIATKKTIKKLTPEQIAKNCKLYRYWYFERTCCVHSLEYAPNHFPHWFL